MKIVFLTQDDPLYILPFFDEFFRQELGEIEVLGIFSCKTMGDRGRAKLLRELFHLYGGFGLTRLLFRAATGKILGGLPARRSSKRFHSVAQICRAFGVPHGFIGNPNQEENRSRIAALAPDLLVSVACPYILKDKLLGLPPLGCINVHHAPLPRYKGMMPTFWQMYHGEKKVGVTIHTMAARVDEGTALLQEQLPIGENESLDSLIRRTKRHGAHCMLGVLQQIARQTQTTLSLASQPGSYFTFPTPAEMKEFRRRGFRAI
ncbi:MAG TPA: formyltransferase family protein [Candidatus Angelobacter sp.]|nr:formyltransferase family protein [Candidatus Angelobacter sp.]